MAFEKYFTAEEANSLVPELLEIVPLIQKFAHHLRFDFPDVERARKQVKNNGGSEEGADYLRIALQTNRLVNHLTSQGCVLKGIKQGLVDFPAMREGREVFLCWKNPESAVTHWHDLEAGFAGRKKLE